MCFIAVLTTAISSLASMALPVFTGWLVSAVSTDKGFSDECKKTAAVLAECRREKLMKTLEIMGLSFIVSGVALSAGLWLFMLSGERLVARLRRRLFGCYLTQDIAFFDGSKTGELMNRLASDCTELKTTLTRSLGEGMHNLIQLAVGLTLMLISSPVLTLITLGSAPLIGIFGGLYGAFVAKLSQRYQKALADASDVAQQALSSIRTVRSFAMEGHEKQRYDTSVHLSFAIGAKRAAALSAFIGLVSTVAQVSLGTITGSRTREPQQAFDRSKLLLAMLLDVALTIPARWQSWCCGLDAIKSSTENSTLGSSPPFCCSPSMRSPRSAASCRFSRP